MTKRDPLLTVSILSIVWSILIILSLALLTWHTTAPGGSIVEGTVVERDFMFGFVLIVQTEERVSAYYVDPETFAKYKEGDSIPMKCNVLICAVEE